MKIKFLPLFAIISLSLVLRLSLLDRIPIGISDDELDYILNAKSIFLTGKDISQTWSPFSLTIPPYENPKAELPYILIAPFIGALNFSLLAARFPYALSSVLLIIVLYLVGKRLFGEKQAFIIGLVAAINPWSIYFGRTSFDAPLAVFFFLLSFYILLIKKGWKIIFSFPFLFLGFYTYIGTKIIFIPFVIIAILFVWKYIYKKKYTFQYVIVLLLSLATIFYFFVSMRTATSARLSEISILNLGKTAQAVNEARKNTIENPLSNLFSNKLTLISQDSINKFLGFYSSQFLFSYGDSRSTFSIWNHGMFYYLDIIFLIIGFYGLYRKYKEVFFLFLSMLLITPLPSVLSNVGTSYPIRSSLAFPFLIIITGFGIWYFLDSQTIAKYKRTITLLLIIFYSLSVANFMYIYLFRNPVYNSEGFGFSNRVVSKYIKSAENNGQKVFVLTNKNSKIIPSLFRQYLFYTNNYNSKSANLIAQNINNYQFRYDNVVFGSCPKKLEKNTVLIAERDFNCKTVDKTAKNLTIARLSDGGEIYKIFNDKICSKYNFRRYPENLSLSDFNVEDLPEKKFCVTFITKLE